MCRLKVIIVAHNVTKCWFN